MNIAFITAYERDNETDLDFAQARYYNKQHGRFTSVDPVKMSSNRMRNPQRLNLYAYAINNPLKYVDPNGEDIEKEKEQRDYNFTITKVDTVNGKNVTTQIDFKVTEKVKDVFDDDGNFKYSQVNVNVSTSGGAENQARLTTAQLDNAAAGAAAIVSASFTHGIEDRSITLAVGAKETIMGATTAGRKDAAVNPMQLTSGQFKGETILDDGGNVMQNTNPSNDRKSNTHLSVLLFRDKKWKNGAVSLETAYKNYCGCPSQDPHYASDSLRYRTEIQQGIQRTLRITPANPQ